MTDHKRALAYAERAIEQGSIDAVRSLGYDDLTGHGVEEDLSKARFNFEKAKAAGDERAGKTLKELNRINPPKDSPGADQKGDSQNAKPVHAESPVNHPQSESEPPTK